MAKLSELNTFQALSKIRLSFQGYIWYAPILMEAGRLKLRGHSVYE